MCSFTAKDWIELIAAGGTVAAAIFAAKSASHSSKAAKISSNPILKLMVLEDGIGPTRFDVRLSNIGQGLAKDIILHIPAIGLSNKIPIIEIGKECNRQPVQDPDKKVYVDRSYKITYKNVFGDDIVTTGRINFEETGEQRAVHGETEWTIHF